MFDGKQTRRTVEALSKTFFRQSWLFQAFIGKSLKNSGTGER
jgi:hypothetical protein